MGKNLRDKLFSGKLRFKDLLNPRYIGRKPIYDFCVEHSKSITGKVLDFGCGSLQYNSVFTSAERIIGLDVKEAIKIFGTQEDVVYYDGKDVPFMDETFDSVFSIECFLCINDYSYSFSEINRILRRGGVFLLTVPFAMPEMENELLDYNRFTKTRLKGELEKSGFEVLKIEGSTSTTDTLRRVRINKLIYEDHAPIVVWKMYTLYSNTLFAMKKGKIAERRFPYGYLVLCRKR